jgi:Sulfotransferase domain
MSTFDRDRSRPAPVADPPHTVPARARIYYLLSYPRSGSTLLRTYLAHLQGAPQLSQYRGDVVVAANRDRPLTRALDGLRLVKSHHFSELHRPAIYLVRDGRNAMLSNLFLRFLSGGHALSRPDQVGAGLRLLDADYEFWGDHVDTALALAASEHVCFVRYEDLIAEPVSALQSIISFMGAAVPDQPLRTAVAAAARSDTYRAAPRSGHTSVHEPGSIYDRIQSDRGRDYWRGLFDADACRWFHERGGTAGLLRFGYERSERWWLQARG